MSKKAAKAHKIEWNRAIAEGRVVRYFNGNSFRSFTTAEAAQTFIKEWNVDGVEDAVIVDPAKAQS